ncbi:MAG: hypothetical protein H7A41_05495 [Chlamydiales bacterium]|nr:hypothetical protein [Chlamydiales bacterium]
MKKGILTSLLLGFLTVGCGVNHYHEKDFQGIGYSDYRMTTDRFVVTYRGDTSIDPEDVHRYALRRAAEVASNYGYRYFIIEDSKDLTKSSLVRTKDEQTTFFEDFWSDRKEPVTKTYETLVKRKNYGTELTIKCFPSRPRHKDDAIDAYQFLAYEATSNVS